MASSFYDPNSAYYGSSLFDPSNFAGNNTGLQVLSAGSPQSISNLKQIATQSAAYNPSTGFTVQPEPNQGAVLGTHTTNNGGGYGGSQGAVAAGINPNDINAQQQWEQRRQAEIAAEQDRQRNAISSGWDSYMGNLNDIGNNFLPQQQQAQTGIADTNLQAGQDTINAQKANSLKDITNNIRNAFQAGNVYLGSRGAGDSSAANQYSFAVQQSANKQVGSLNDYTNTQLNQLKANHDNQINQIAQWFAQAQQQLKQQQAQGQLGKSQDLQTMSQNILNQAVQAANQVKADTSARYNALLTWAANNSRNVGELQQNIAGIPQTIGNPQMNAGNGFTMPVGQDTTKRTDMFGNPI